MTETEVRTLERLFVAVSELRDRMDSRFDSQDERLRNVEGYVTSASVEKETKKALEQKQEERRQRKMITKRWIIQTLVAFGAAFAAFLAIVIKILEYLKVV